MAGAIEPGRRLKFTQVENYLKATLGDSNPLLAKVGITPSKPKAKPSAATKAAAVQKAASTRKAKAVPAGASSGASESSSTVSAAAAPATVTVTAGAVVAASK